MRHGPAGLPVLSCQSGICDSSLAPYNTTAEKSDMSLKLLIVPKQFPDGRIALWRLVMPLHFARVITIRLPPSLSLSLTLVLSKSPPRPKVSAFVFRWNTDTKIVVTRLQIHMVSPGNHRVSVK